MLRIFTVRMSWILSYLTDLMQLFQGGTINRKAGLFCLLKRRSVSVVSSEDSPSVHCVCRGGVEVCLLASFAIYKWLLFLEQF